MKKMKLFPKTFLYVFFLMAVIALISHALFFFLMPLVYTAQKEEAFKDAETQLIEELQTVLNDSADNMEEVHSLEKVHSMEEVHSLEEVHCMEETRSIESIVRKHALQNQMGILVYYAGHTYNFMVNENSSDSDDSAAQKEFESNWNVQVGEKTELNYFQQDFYKKTDSQLYSGSHFQTKDGQPCYLVMFLTLQPVNEAKNAVVIFLPFTLILSLALSAIFALLYSKKITKPLSDISKAVERMEKLDRSALCSTDTQDEIGALSENINKLYQSLLAAIDDLQKENIRVSEAEAGKIDFLRAASHELKTPVTALCGMLDNMIMGIGRYKDWETYLPICHDMAGKFSKKIQEILDASKLNFAFESEPLKEVMLHTFVERLLAPYLLIAKSKGVIIDTDFSAGFSAKLPKSAMEKVLSNIISNAVKYTKPQCTVRIYFGDKSIVVENECAPIPPNDLSHIFEPFYRPDFSRSRNSMGENPEGGNGLGLYITAKILNVLEYRFDFKPFLHPDDDIKSGMRFTIFF